MIDLAKLTNREAIAWEMGRPVDSRADHSYETGVFDGLTIALKILNGCRCTPTCNANLIPGAAHTCALKTDR